MGFAEGMPQRGYENEGIRQILIVGSEAKKTSAGNQNCRHLSEEGIVYGEKELSVEYGGVFPPLSFHIGGMHSVSA